MADTLDTLSVFTGVRRVVRRYTNISDGTGESEANKLDISTLTGPDGKNAPTAAGVEWIQFAIQGFSSVTLLWDHDTDDEIARLSGNGYHEFGRGMYMKDPRSTGGSGDILLTTVGAAANATYDITVGYILEE